MKPERIREFYERELGVNLPAPNSAGEVSLPCPFHADSKPSMSVNLSTGMWKCFTCDIGGSVYDFYMESHGVDDFNSAKFAVDKGEFLPTVPEEEVSEWHEALLDTPRVLKWLEKKRGITLASVKKFQLGWNGERITIPIRDIANRIVNVRMYKPNASSMKMISYGTGFGTTRLFPIHNLDKKSVVIFEGELDSILADQMGIPAVTCTGGAGTWKKTWNKWFRGKKAYICYDIDDQGKKGSIKVAKSLAPVVKTLKVIELPIETPANADFTDYVIEHGNSSSDFKTLLRETPQYGKERKVAEAIEQREPIDLHLSKASHESFYNQYIGMNVIVAGKDLAPYLVPRKVTFSCNMEEGKKCNLCTLQSTMGSYAMEIHSLDPILLELIDCPSGTQKGILKQLADIPASCKSFEYETTEAYNIEEVYLMPEIDFSTVDTEYVIRRAFYVGHGIRTNQSYYMTGITVPEPHRQYATHLLNQAVPVKDDVSTFEVTPDVKETLSVFQPSEEQSVSDKMDEIASDFTYNVTHIYGREDLITAIDLVYHSVQSFDFQEKHILKGWNELVVVGDTRTGKSETMLMLMQHYRMGEFITGENTSFAGLVGGMQQNQKRWSITWGKIPLNDRRLVAVDECGSLPEETIQRMSGIRSSGIAEITKIQTEKTHARTRLIFMGNPRNGKSMSSYAFGVNALRELIGAPEDIARFDLAYAASASDVPLDVINAEFRSHNRVPHRYDTDACTLLIRWVWSRTSEQVVFSRGVEKSILELATEQGTTYSNRIPLIEAANQRIKIAKLAVAVAARLYSTDRTGEKIVVTREHVSFVGEFLERVYKTKTLGYHEFSRQQLQNIRVADDHRDSVYKMMKGEPDLANIFLTYSHVRIVDIIDMLDCEREEAKHYLKTLVQSKMLFKTQNGFMKSPAFTEILRDIQSEMIEEES